MEIARNGTGTVTKGRFELISGHPALDLVNTLDWRVRDTGSEEFINNYADVVRFIEQLGVRNLRLHPETELDLGQVHLTEGRAGTRRRVAAAQAVVPDFGLATECGLGRRPAEIVPELLRLHIEALADAALTR